MEFWPGNKLKLFFDNQIQPDYKNLKWKRVWRKERNENGIPSYEFQEKSFILNSKEWN